MTAQHIASDAQASSARDRTLSGPLSGETRRYEIFPSGGRYCVMYSTLRDGVWMRNLGDQVWFDSRRDAWDYTRQQGGAA
jgi:hypothetical protein